MENIQIQQKNFLFRQKVSQKLTVSERDFGSLDLLIRMKPAATTLCYESVILWTNNKTSEWLNSLDHDIKNKLLDHARVRAPEVKRMFNDKRETIKKQKLEKLKENQTKKRAKGN